MPFIDTCGACPFFNDGKPLKPGQVFARCSTMPKNKRAWREVEQNICPPMWKTTLPLMWWHMMGAPDAGEQQCVVCGSTWHLNRHHPVKKSAGELYGADGKAVRKPKLLICGNGNTEGCHGLAHQGKLHFSYNGEWLYLLLDESTDYLSALEMDGWRSIHY